MLSLSLSLVRNGLIAAVLTLAATPVWADLAPDEANVKTNSYGLQKEQQTLRVNLWVYNGPAGHYEKVDGKQEIALPCVGSTLLYPGHFQYTYSTVVDDLTPGSTYYGDIEMQFNGTWTHIKNTEPFEPGPP